MRPRLGAQILVLGAQPRLSLMQVILRQFAEKGWVPLDRLITVNETRAFLANGETHLEVPLDF